MEYACAYTGTASSSSRVIYEPEEIDFQTNSNGIVSLVGQEQGGPSALDHVSNTFEPINLRDFEPTNQVEPEKSEPQEQNDNKKFNNLGWGVKSFLTAQRSTRSLIDDDEYDLSVETEEKGQFLGELESLDLHLNGMEALGLGGEEYSRMRSDYAALQQLPSSDLDTDKEEAFKPEAKDRKLPYKYKVVYKGGVLVRSQPHTEAPPVGLVIPYGAVFTATKSRQLDGIVYVKLADGKGWVFEQKGDTKVLERVIDQDQEKEAWAQLDEIKPCVTQVSTHFLSSGFHQSRLRRVHRQQVKRLQERLTKARSLADLIQIIDNPQNQFSDVRISCDPRKIKNATSRHLWQLQGLQQLVSVVESTGLEINAQMLGQSLWILAHMGEQSFPIIKRIVKEADARLILFGRSHLMQLAVVFSGIGHRIDPLLERLSFSTSQKKRNPDNQRQDVLEGQKQEQSLIPYQLKDYLESYIAIQMPLGKEDDDELLFENHRQRRLKAAEAAFYANKQQEEIAARQIHHTQRTTNQRLLKKYTTSFYEQLKSKVSQHMIQLKNKDLQSALAYL